MSVSSRRAFSFILAVVAVPVLCSVPSLAQQATGEDQCLKILFGPQGGVDQPPVVLKARDAHKDWPNPQSTDHREAVQDIEIGFLRAENQLWCQALMLLSADPSLLHGIYRQLFDQSKSKIENLVQSGGNAGSSGTTNLVSKNFTSQLLSAASEYGGITQSTSGQTTTFNGSLSGIPLAIESETGIPLLAECSVTTHNQKCVSQRLIDGLSRFSFSAGVNTSGGTAGTGTAGTGTGSTQPVSISSTNSASNYSLNQITVKAVVLRKPPTPSDISDAIKKAVGDKADSNDGNGSKDKSSKDKNQSKSKTKSDNKDKSQDGKLNPDTATDAWGKSLTDLYCSCMELLPSDDKDYNYNRTLMCKHALDKQKRKAEQCSDAKKAVMAKVLSYIDAGAEDLLQASGAVQQQRAWDDAAQQFEKAMTAAAAYGIDADYKGTVATYVQALAERAAEEDIIYSSSWKPTLSLEYDLNTPANQPTNSVFKIIGSWVPNTHRIKNWTFTLNGAASIYNSQPPSSVPSGTRIRDFQLSGEGDYKIPKSLPIVGQPTLTWAYYYQDQTSPSLLKVPISGLPITGLSSSTNEVFTTRGPINIGQFRISLGKSSSGVKVPLSMTVSNRTELLTGMDVRGQVGISYDFASLLSK